jgi:hypothetical protein
MAVPTAAEAPDLHSAKSQTLTSVENLDSDQS